MPRWIEVTVVMVYRGIIQLIEPNGMIASYRQKGIDKLSHEMYSKMMHLNRIDPCWRQYPIIPDNYVLTVEDPEIQGKVYKDFTKDKRNYIGLRG